MYAFSALDTTIAAVTAKVGALKSSDPTTELSSAY
jgi:hypothetical protein